MGTWAVAKCKHTYNEPGRDVTWTALVISVYSVWDVTWTAINALVISSDLCSVWQFHIFHIAMTGSSLLKPVDRGGSVGSDEPPRLPNGPLEVFKNYYTGYFWLHKLLLLV